MSEAYDKLQTALKAVREKTDFVPDIALVLGSGLGAYADSIRTVCEIPYSDLPGFPVSTVQGHSGKFIFGYDGDKKVVCMKGRVHMYEGYEPSDVVMPIRLMYLMGAKILFLTNAAGGINESFHPGCLMLIEDQISFLVRNPLIGPNVEELGTRFPDMTRIYDKDLSQIIIDKAAEQNSELFKGVYVQLSGPSYESPSDVKALRILGGSAVGMSTAIEAIAARHAGMKVCGISVISNMAAGITGEELNHEDVQKAADSVSKRFEELVRASIAAF